MVVIVEMDHAPMGRFCLGGSIGINDMYARHGRDKRLHGIVLVLLLQLRNDEFTGHGPLLFVRFSQHPMSCGGTSTRNYLAREIKWEDHFMVTG